MRMRPIPIRDNHLIHTHTVRQRLYQALVDKLLNPHAAKVSVLDFSGQSMLLLLR